MIRTLLLAAFIVSTGYSTDLHPREIERLGGTSRPIPKKIDRSQLRAPTGPIRNIAEFEPHEGCIVSYPGQFGITLDLIKEISEVSKVYCLTGYASTVQTQFSNAGISNYEIVNFSPDEIWMRDCAPWWIFDGNDDACIIDFNYNRPSRPNDNKVPAKMATELGVTRYDMGINDCGGNWMCDGLGLGAATNLLHEENNGVDVETAKKNYLGIETLITVDDPSEDQSYQIDHIDCWGKFLAPDKIIIRKVPQSNQPTYNNLEEVAAMYANKTSSYGTKFKVYRVYSDVDGEAYTNSLIINNKVLVPIKGTANDAAALQSYRDAMPGYDVIGIEEKSSRPWLSTDALHCRTKGIPDRGMLYVRHIPLNDTVTISSSSDNVEVSCKILAHSGSNLKSDSLLVCYKYSYDSYYKSATLSSFGSDLYKLNLPLPTTSSKVEYYITASDNSGRNETHPYMGNQDPHTFYVDMGDVPVAEVLGMQRTLNMHAMQVKRAISVQFEMPGNVSDGIISLYNSKGMKIDSKVSLSGNGRVSLGSQLSNGVYFVKVNAGSFNQAKSIVIK